MRTRHRVPSVFNLYMLDVLCCALGCVILVWQLDLDKVKENDRIAADNRAKTEKLLADAEHARDSTFSENNDLKAALAAKSAESSDRQTALDRAALTSAKLKASIEDLEKRLRESEAQARVLADAVAAADKQKTSLNDKLSTAAKQRGDADKLIVDLTARLAAAEKLKRDLQPLAELVPDLEAQLKAAKQTANLSQKEIDANAKKLVDAYRLLNTKDAALAAKNLETQKLSDQLALARLMEKRAKAAEDKLAAIERDFQAGKLAIAEAERDVGALKTQKRSLEAELDRIRIAADNRFAGITLTGRRVVFLVDMSGSMFFVDEKTRAPEKWSEVRNTLLKVMKSLPDLEKYQIIVFSKEASYLLGKPDEWIDFVPKTSLTQVEEAMKSLKPEGNTNMYSAFELTFRFRPKGLDTVYLLSDGLPNAGEGVPADEAQRLMAANREPELSERLAKHILRTLKSNWNREILKERVRINAIGFFYESPDVGAFLWALARENDGSFVGMSKP